MYIARRARAWAVFTSDAAHTRTRYYAVARIAA